MRIPATTLLLLAIASPPAIAAPVEAGPTERQRVLALAADLARVPAQADQVWPGYALARIPVILHAPGRVAYLIDPAALTRGLAKPVALPPGFKPLPGAPGIAMAVGLADLPPTLTVRYPLGDRDGVVMGLDTLQSHDPVETIVHEAFHQHQFGHHFFARGTGETMASGSTRDLVLKGVENGLLADALTAATPAAAGSARRTQPVRSNEQAIQRMPMAYPVPLEGRPARNGY